jgi:hypothetical protein
MKKASVYDSVGISSVSRFCKRIVVGLCILLLTCQISCRETPSEQEPATQPAASAEPLLPDLRGCEQIKIWLAPSTIEFLCPAQRLRTLLNPEEIRYLEAAAPFIVDNPEVVQTFAKDISSSTYKGPALVGYSSATRYGILFTCYERSGREISFGTYGNMPEAGNTVFANGHLFKNHGIDWRTLAPQIWPFPLRVKCALNLEKLYAGLRGDLDEKESYPLAIEWYDATVHSYQVGGYIGNVARLDKAISCPGASHGRYHYAINPDCDPNSPPDTVLLFEARPGRNQHGGPELFTFDNHDPKGGCVLLNDCTVKFIRTKEELHQLRWK